MIKKGFSSVKLAFIDLETSGLDPFQHEILEIGCVIYDQEKDKVLDEWDKKIAPKRIETASRAALEMNGYLKSPKSYKGDLKTSLLKFNKIVDGCMIVGQNIEFDVGFLESSMDSFKIQPTYDRHRKLELMSIAWPVVKNELNSLSLKSFCDFFNVSNQGAHTALADCHRTLEVYRCLMEIYKTK